MLAYVGTGSGTSNSGLCVYWLTNFRHWSLCAKVHMWYSTCSEISHSFAVLNPDLQLPFSHTYMMTVCLLYLSHLVSLCSPAWRLSLYSLLPLAGNPKSPASVSLPSHWLLATLFTNQNQLGAGTSVSYMKTCSLGNQINTSSIRANPQHSTLNFEFPF